MLLNIPQSPMLDTNSMLSAEWLIFFNELARLLAKLEAEKADKVP